MRIPCLSLILLLALTISPAGGQTNEGKALVEIRFDGDYLRLEELTKRFAAEVVRFDPPSLVLLLNRDRLPALQQEGYAVRFLDPDAVLEQVVRVEPATDALIAKAKEIGGHLIQREAAYAVFRVDRRELRLLQQQGIQVRPIREGELAPRWVEIAAADDRAVAAVVAAGVDIFEGRDGLLFGHAFDDQIETLTRQGLKVEVVNPSYPPPPP